MNQKTRGYTALNVCMALIVVGGVLYIGGGLLVFTATLGSGNPTVADFAVSGLQFTLAVLCFTLAGFIRLAVHVADDLYMLRLIAVNLYARFPQPPKPAP